MQRVAASMLTIILSMTFFTFVDAGWTKTITVEAGSERVEVFELDQRDMLTAHINISGGPHNDINLRVTDPTGKIFLDLGRSSGYATVSFQANQSGTHTLHFDNSFSLTSSKTVTLTCYVQKPMMPCIQPNIPDPFLIVLFMNVLLLIAVIVLATALVLSRRKPETPLGV